MPVMTVLHIMAISGAAADSGLDELGQQHLDEVERVVRGLLHDGRYGIYDKTKDVPVPREEIKSAQNKLEHHVKGYPFSVIHDVLIDFRRWLSTPSTTEGA